MNESHTLIFQNHNYSGVKTKGQETGRNTQKIVNVSVVFSLFKKF